MAFCPNCEAEYIEGITVCSDCGYELVPKLTPETRIHDTSEGEPVPLRSFKTSSEAQMVAEMLVNSGVRAFVEGGEFAVLPGAFSEEIVVMVDERDLSRAIEIYEAYFASETAPTNGEDADDAE